MGLHQAGFEVVGVDAEPHPDYPFEFVLGDALTYPLAGFDLIWASPPCQGFTAYKRRPGHVKPRPNLIPPIRERLRASGTPYIIENVPGAPLENPVMLCGSMFGLDVRRHRNFECSFDVTPPKCDHKSQAPRFPPATNRKNLRRTVEVGVWRIPLDVQQRAMGIDWMTTPLRQDIADVIVALSNDARTELVILDRVMRTKTGNDLAAAVREALGRAHAAAKAAAVRELNEEIEGLRAQNAQLTEALLEAELRRWLSHEVERG